MILDRPTAFVTTGSARLSRSIHQVQPPLKFIAPRFNPLVLRLTLVLLPILLRIRTRPWLMAHLAHIRASNVETLVKLYDQFQNGKVRLLMAFHHPEVDDPLCIGYLLSRLVPQTAQELGIPLTTPIHSHFLFDRGMMLWAGRWLGWLFSRLGGISIRRGKRIDWNGLQTARQVMATGQFPLAVAPEGANNGHGGMISPLEPGVAQLGFWCVEDLQQANRSESVVILPIGLQYYYIQPPWAGLDRLLSQLETNSGLPSGSVQWSEQNRETIFYHRLLRLANHLLTEMEQFYRQVYHQDLSEPGHQTLSDFRDPESIHPEQMHPEQIIDRLQRLLDKALQVSEHHFGLTAQGTIGKRCRRVEEAGWTAIYREDNADRQALSPFQRGLADWTAEIADLQMRHMRLVESFVAVTTTYIRDQPTVERFVETTMIIFDLMARIKGEKQPRRPCLGWRWVQIRVGEPIVVNERWTDYSQNRQAAKQAITTLTADLHTALEQLVR